MRTISIKAKYTHFGDQQTLDNLASYCRSMKLTLETMQVNDDIVLWLTGEDQQLDEVETYLNHQREEWGQ